MEGLFRNPMEYIETSAVTGENVQKLFSEIVHLSLGYPNLGEVFRPAYVPPPATLLRLGLPITPIHMTRKEYEEDQERKERQKEEKREREEQRKKEESKGSCCCQ